MKNVTTFLSVLLAILMTAVPTECLSQNNAVEIRGQVTAENKDAIEGVSVFVNSGGRQYEGRTNGEGRYSVAFEPADAVTIKATPATGYDFLQWTDAAGNVVTSQNPYTYYGKEAALFTAHFAVNKWGTVTENWADRNDIKNYEQYLVQMSVSQNGGSPVQIYSTAQMPATLFNVVPTAVNAPRGSSFTLSWSDSDRRGLSYCRLSAYIDLNADGDFTDEGEFLEVRGNKNQAGNATVSVGTLQIVLPYDMPLGITHVRLRFDGAWSGGWDSVTDAKPATAEADTAGGLSRTFRA